MVIYSGEILEDPEEIQRLLASDRYELVDGTIRERNRGIVSSWVSGEILGRLRDYCRTHRRGWVFPSDSGYQCFPHRPRLVRYPDVSVIRFGRLENEQLPEGHCKITPDLAIEVVSPNDSYYEVDEKRNDYLKVQIPLVWIVSPHTQSIIIYRADGTAQILNDNAEINGENILPEFRCLVRDFFPPEPTKSQSNVTENSAK